jgi:hypothetical protein
LVPTAGVFVGAVVVVVVFTGWVVGFFVVVVAVLGTVVVVGPVSKLVKGVPSISFTALGLANIP